MSPQTDTIAVQTPTPGASTQDVVDRLSLEQALLDVEVANARVIDLTARLGEMSVEVQQLRARVAELSVATRPASVSASALLDSPRLDPLRRLVRALVPAGLRHRINMLLR